MEENKQKEKIYNIEDVVKRMSKLDKRLEEMTRLVSSIEGWVSFFGWLTVLSFVGGLIYGVLLLARW